MPAMVGYLALGLILPASPYAFAELAFTGYVRQPAGFDFDAVPASGAVEAGDPVLRLSNAVSIPAPAGGLPWPAVNAFALYAAKTGGTPRLLTQAPGLARLDLTARGFAAGALFLTARGSRLESCFGEPVRAAPVYVDPVAGVVSIATAFTSLAGALPAP